MVVLHTPPRLPRRRVKPGTRTDVVMVQPAKAAYLARDRDSPAEAKEGPDELAALPAPSWLPGTATPAPTLDQGAHGPMGEWGGAP